jgi:hypothetical protein
MAALRPGELADRFEVDTDTNVLSLRGNTTLGGVDTFQLPMTGSGTVFNALAASPATIMESDVVLLNLTDYSEVRIVSMVDIAGSAGSVMRAYYSTDLGTYTALTTNTINLASATTQTTDWEDLPTAAKGLVAVTFGAIGGNGSDSPRSFIHTLMFRR